MGDVIQFLPRAALPSERARRMIAEARAQYQAIFPDEPVEDTAPCEYCPDNLA
jgi:hypothetical protein